MGMETIDLSQQMAALAMDGINRDTKVEMEAEVTCEVERFSQARARTDPVYILQQQHIQLQLHQQQQQKIVMQQQQQQQQQLTNNSFPSLVSHQQICCPPHQL